MGQAIATTNFSDQDFAVFTERLRAETALLGQWFADRAFEYDEPTIGFRTECWLVGPDLAPLPRAEEILARAGLTPRWSRSWPPSSSSSTAARHLCGATPFPSSPPG